MYTQNREIIRFVDHVGGLGKASELLGVSEDMIRKMKTGHRGVKKKHVQVIYRTKGFRLSLKELFDLD